MDHLTIIKEIITERRPASQIELQDLLQERGVTLGQSSLSRLLKRANILKAGGHYRLPSVLPGESRQVDFLHVVQAGEHMLVIKTPIGAAARAAYLIDNAKIPGMAGTISGDDTIFAALSEAGVASQVAQQITLLFRAQQGGLL